MKTFIAASQLFEVLTVFGELSEEIKERQKYAKYRAAVIMKALKSNEKPPLPEGADEPQLPPIPPSETSSENEEVANYSNFQPNPVASVPERPVSPSCSHSVPEPTHNVTQSKCFNNLFKIFLLGDEW